jgi:hypothetical protein
VAATFPVMVVNPWMEIKDVDVVCHFVAVNPWVKAVVLPSMQMVLAPQLVGMQPCLGTLGVGTGYLFMVVNPVVHSVGTGIVKPVGMVA